MVNLNVIFLELIFFLKKIAGHSVPVGGNWPELFKDFILNAVQVKTDEAAPKAVEDATQVIEP